MKNDQFVLSFPIRRFKGQVNEKIGSYLNAFFLVTRALRGWLLRK